MGQKWDVVIIGGGLAGLVAANYLAKNDLSILVLEKGKTVGGRARTNQIYQQYFNLGPHALSKKGKAKSILEELNIHIIGKSPKLGGTLVKDNLEYTAPFTPLNLFTTNLLNLKERMEWAKVLMKLTSINTEKLAQHTFEQWVQQTTDSANVQSLLFLLGRLATYCHTPNKASAKVIVSHMKTVLSGVLYLDNGWQTIIDQLNNRAVISGVQIQTDQVVKHLDPIDHDHFKLVLSNGEELLSKYVVCTTGPHELHHMLGEQSSFSKIRPVKGATLDVALTELPNPKKLFAMGITDPLYFSVHSNYARLSVDGKSTVLHVFKYHTPDEHIDGKKVKKELEQFLEKLQPGSKDYEITSRFLPQITVNQRLPQIGDKVSSGYHTAFSLS
ncbi:phytoene desaturase family protein [Lentibacillus saliphilus]|uniref:phytoene desaturase family protein n=1 Tax=Lentibacillus saliphilus TaxID=2737028 RepID=UPI001C308F5E|nr:FAD-dependent oxidoreductase [Lentibacillus saliphilus]